MRKAKTIDQLYEEVKDYDFVVSNDAALVTALNAMLTESKLDGFAFTPKILASMVEGTVLGTRPLTDLEVVERIERDTGLDFRYIHSEIENIRDIRKYTASVNKYLYSRRAGEVLEAYDQCPTTEKVMSIFDSTVYRYHLTGKKVAVIGLSQFNDLDKHMLPPEFDEIEAFTDGEFDIGTIYGIGNDRQIASNIVDLIERETANDTAIILDPNSGVADAIKSALYRKHIPFENKLVMKDLAQVRDYIEFITLALDYRTIRVKDVRELFSVFQKGKNSNKLKELLPKEDNYLLHKIPIDDNTEPVTRTLIETMRNIRDCTFSYVAEILYKGMPQLTSVLMLLKYMRLEDEKITSVLVARLTYAVNNVSDLKHNEEIPEDEKFGVLLADCRNATYVDRSFVILVGLDDSWEVKAPGKEYVDKEKLDEDNAYRLSILLQQGTTRIYAVKPASGGKPTIPCATFLTMFKEDGRPRNIKSFRDICTEYKTGSWYRPTVRKPADVGERVPDAPYDDSWKFSKTSYNAYRDCPIKFMFSELLDGEDNGNLLFGNCLHDFAEFYLCYPDMVRENGITRYLGFMEEEYAGISNECQRELDLSKFRVFANNLMKYIDSVRPAQVPLDVRNDSRKYPNRLIEMEGLEMCSSLAEGRMVCDDPIFSKMDLCIGNLICDYKTGKTMELENIVAKFGDKADYHDFQALIYLAVLAANRDGDGEFDLFYIGANDIQSVTGEYDIGDSVRKVVYTRKHLADILLAPGSPLKNYAEITQTVAKMNDNWNSIYDTLYEAIDDRSIGSDASLNALVDAAGLPANKGNLDAARSLAKKAIFYIKKGYQIIGDEVIVTADVMEEFLAHLREDRKTAAGQLQIPIYKLDKGRYDCGNCDFRNVCLKNYKEEDDE